MEDFDNDLVLDVTMDELPEDLKAMVERACKEYEQKCLMSFSRNESNEIYQKSFLPRVLLPHQTDYAEEEETRKMSELTHRALGETMMNHNTAFLSILQTIMVRTFGPGADKYCQETMGPIDGPVLFNVPRNSEKNVGNEEMPETRRDKATSHEASRRPTYGQVVFGTTAELPDSAFKISPAANRLQRNLYGNGYQEFADYAALNALPNPGYQSASGLPSGVPTQGAPDSNIDLIMHRMADMMQNQFGLKPKDQSYSYK